MIGPTANQGADSMMLGNFSPPSNLLSQFVSQDVEEEVAGVNKKPFACSFQDRQFQNP